MPLLDNSANSEKHFITSHRKDRHLFIGGATFCKHIHQSLIDASPYDDTLTI